MTIAAIVKPAHAAHSSRVERLATMAGSLHEVGPWALVAAAYAAACRVMLAPIFNFGKLSTASYGGDARAFIWVLAWSNHAVLDRVPALFDANKLYPLSNSLAYGEHLFGISLFTLPIYAATRNPVLAYNIVWLLCYVFTAAAGHLLAWRLTRDHAAALVGGMAFAFCFFRMHHGHGHLNLIWCFWIPLSFIAIEAWFAKPTWPRLAICVAVVVLQALAAWYQAVMIAVADLVFLAWLTCVEGRRVPLGRAALHAAIAAAASFAAVWPFARRYFALHVEPPAYAAGSSADLVGWFVPPENTIAGQWLLAHGIKGPRWIWGEVTVYLGWTILLLAIAGAVAILRGRGASRQRGGFYLVLAAVAGALALGPTSGEVASGVYGWSPFGLLAHVPGPSLFRIPARYTELLNLALAMLAAIGCAAVHRRFGRRAWALSAAAICLLLVESYLVNFPGGPPQPFGIPPIYKYVATLPPGAVLSLPDYANTPLWFEEADYQYFSTAHWHPIVNGDSREFPPSFLDLMARLKRFPDGIAATAMRDAGIEYVVLHAARPEAASMLGPAEASGDFHQLARFDHDFLFEVAR